MHRTHGAAVVQVDPPFAWLVGGVQVQRVGQALGAVPGEQA
jgi:hypothetical protein